MGSVVVLSGGARYITVLVDSVNSVAEGAAANGHDSVLDLAARSAAWAVGARALVVVEVLVARAFVANFVVVVLGVSTLAATEDHGAVGVVATG